MAFQLGILRGTEWRIHPQGGLLASPRGAACWWETSDSLHVVLSLGRECPKGMAAGFLQGNISKNQGRISITFMTLPSSIGQTDQPVGGVPQRGKLKRKGPLLAIWEATHHRCLLRALTLNVQINPNLSSIIPPIFSISHNGKTFSQLFGSKLVESSLTLKLSSHTPFPPGLSANSVNSTFMCFQTLTTHIFQPSPSHH